MCINNTRVFSFQPEYFQDDIFPDVRVTWEASLTGEEWLDGNSADQKWISLKPSDMKKCMCNLIEYNNL